MISSSQALTSATLVTGTDVIPINWVFLLYADLAVIRTRAGVDTNLTYGADYTVAGGGQTSGLPATGTVTMVTGAAADIITVYRAVPDTQTTQLTTLSSLPAKTLETTYDRTVMQLQTLQNKLDRALVVPMSDPALANLAKAAARANLLLGFDGAGVPYLYPSSSSPGVVSSSLATATGSITPRTMAVRLGEVVNVKDYGAVGDNSTNDYTAFAAALAAASAQGGDVFIPAGVYKIQFPFAIAGFTIPAGVCLRGVPGAGVTTLNIYDSGQSLTMFTVASGCAFSHFDVNNFSTTFGTTPIIAFYLAGTTTRVVFDSVSINGRAAGTGTSAAHGILIADNGSSTNVKVFNCYFFQCNYGIFTRNAFSGACNTWRVYGNKFANSYADDIEFNAPSVSSGGGGGSWTDVVVYGNNFNSNQYAGASAGFGVGLSGNVVNAVVKGNTFNVYTQEAIHLENGVTNAIIANNVLNLCVQGMKISASSFNTTSRVLIYGNTCKGAASAITGTPSTSYGIQIVDGGGTIFPTHVQVLDNHVYNYDIGLLGGGRNGAFDTIVRGNKVMGSACGYSGFPNPMVKDNEFNSCTAGFNFSTGQGIVGYNRLVDVTNLFYSTTGKIQFAGLGIVINGLVITNGSTLVQPIFATPTAMYSESIALALSSNNFSVSTVSLCSVTAGALTETSHYSASVGAIGIGTHSIATGSLNYSVNNTTGSTVTVSIEHHFTGGITFN